MITLRYNDMGGYDGMTAAFLLDEGGITVVVVDLKDFGQRCDGKQPSTEMIIKADRVALAIQQALNELEGPLL